VAKKLTAAKIGNIKPNLNKRLEIPDGGKPGLYLVVQPSGRMSWVVRYRRLSDRKPRKFTIDGFPSLALAHKLAQAVLDKVAEGRDPAAEKIVEKQKARNADPSDIQGAFCEFLRRHIRKKNGQPIRMSTRMETARLLGLKPDPEREGEWVATGNGVLKRWKGRTVESITKGDVLSLIEDMAEAAPVGANRTLAALRTFFTWCIKRDKLTVHPCAGIDDPSPEQSRDRALSDAELAACWRAAENQGYPYGTLVQLLILTGCRRDEVREASWSEINLESGTWLIPGGRTKNGHDHLVPLSAKAIEILESLPRIKGGLLITTNGRTPFSGLSRAKRALDDAMLREIRKTNSNAELAPWRLHDLRHTLKTWMQRARVAKDVRNAVQNHHDRDMDELYGHYTFEAEKRQALESWARHIEAAVSGNASDNIVPMQRGA